MAVVPENIQSALRALKNKRSFVKRNNTMLKNEFDKIESFENVTEVELGRVREQLNVCESKMALYIDYLEEVYDADYEAAFEEYFLDGEFRDTVIKIKSIMQKYALSNSTDSTRPFKQRAELPRLNLCTFSGRYDQWLSFKDSFTTDIHTNPDLSAIQKLQYLKSSLKGDALDVIRNVETTESNYQVALDLLTDRFENKRVIVKNHIRGLFEYPQAAKETHAAIRQLIDTFQQHLRSLKSLGRPVDQWDDLMIHLLASKLPAPTRQVWEESIKSVEPPGFSDLIKCLTHKCHVLEACKDDQTNNTKSRPKAAASHAVTNRTSYCNVCSGDHFTDQCSQYLQLAVNARIEAVKLRKLCANCLRKGHAVAQCRASKCKHCNKQHHSTLHISNATNTSDSNANASATTSCHAREGAPAQVLLSTCLVQVRDIWGNPHNARALLDSGSQINFMRNKLANELGLQREPIKISITGISSNAASTQWCVETSVTSTHANYEAKTVFYILDQITNLLPTQTFDQNAIHIPKNVLLADPLFYKSQEIDLLIGAELFYDLLSIGRIQTNVPGVLLQKSKLGWLVTGKVPDGAIPANIACHLATLKALNESVQRFWLVDDVQYAKPLRTEEEQAAETHFQQTFSRNETGRFVVSLPFKANPNILGDSLKAAKNRYLAIERKLERDPARKREYDAFLEEYLQMGHMTQVNVDQLGESGYYLPHHAVFRDESLTTKLRVVFDASMKTTSGQSLNDVLMVGPAIQEDLFSILLRFRTHQYVITADIAKMYRQIELNENDTKYQRILWRKNKVDEIKTYELKTVTYGTCPASFLATRCLAEIAERSCDKNPKIARMIASDFYMDDLLSGADDIDELRQLSTEIDELLKQYGFELRKWTANDSSILREMNSEDDKHKVVTIKANEPIKTLGVQWVPTCDTIQYHSRSKTPTAKITKRAILSEIAQLFDPLGLLGPIIVSSKAIMQELWRLNISWDEVVPSHLYSAWVRIINELQNVNEITIPRKVIIAANSIVEIHGFCDASQTAYGACVYLKSYTNDGTPSSQLLCAKSKIAPLKQLSIPRLELCAAVLLAQLVDKIKRSIKREIARETYYSDSTITLCWIRSTPTRWKTFVANRVSDLQTLTDVSNWEHVLSAENPADIISRGCSPMQLNESTLWWNGPTWLIKGERNTKESEHLENIPEERVVISANAAVADEEIPFVTNFSNYGRLLRVTAWCLRFCHNAAHKQNKFSGNLSAREINNAEVKIIQIVQAQTFKNEIVCLEAGQNLNRKSSILSLDPFLDKDRMLRVGGRLRKSSLAYEAKFPILLPSKHHVSRLIIKSEHIKNLHAGALTTLANLRQRFWLLAARNAVRKVIHECVTCFKNRPICLQPKMGDLPCYRTVPSRPFSKTGVDYFGPLYVKEGSRRSRKTVKCYGAIFICMATTAVHIELVSDLTSEAFIGALRRFVSRRGDVTDLYSDNGTNFVGANNELKELLIFLKTNIREERIANELANRRIAWHFIPPRAPHFGGLWERAVRSAKQHLYRTLGNALLTFEETYTVLVQIEAVINSRPLTAMSHDPNDLSVLTPNHFLTGTNSMGIPDPDLTDIQQNRLNRWQRVQQLQQQFWKRWQREYLSQLQSRKRWTQSAKAQLEVNQLVLIKEDNVPPRTWKMGRILQVHPGDDGEVRVVTLKTASDIVKRPAVRVCVLPIENDN